MEEKFFLDNTIFRSEDMNIFQIIVSRASTSIELFIKSAEQNTSKYIENYTKAAEIYSKVANSLPNINEKLNDFDNRLKQLENNLTNIGGD